MRKDRKIEFGLCWTDEETGLFIQRLYWTTNGRCYMLAINGGVELKPKRISEAEMISAWETYRNV